LATILHIFYIRITQEVLLLELVATVETAVPEETEAHQGVLLTARQLPEARAQPAEPEAQSQQAGWLVEITRY
jgi:hypothetical protein